MLRALKSQIRCRPGQSQFHQDLAVLFVNGATNRMETAARRVLEATSEPQDYPAALDTARELLTWTPVNSVALQRRVAGHICERGGYPT